MPEKPLQQRMQEHLLKLQERMCESLERFEPSARFCLKPWQYREKGGGITRAVQNGQVLEKAAVNFSAVEGTLPKSMAEKFSVQEQGFSATGISSIIHPRNPYAPTVHLNYRYFELAQGDAWFGGGIDMTPYYIFEEDARLLHSVLKRICDKHDLEYYPRFKKWADEYFYLPHRQEARGVGGIFFDYLRSNPEKVFEFVLDAGEAFFEAYLPVLQRRLAAPYGEKERHWQCLRRGRYVEFNLLYDRGTKFGLESGGATESILLSLPPEVLWEYDFKPEAQSREAELLKYLTPTDWISK